MNYLDVAKILQENDMLSHLEKLKSSREIFYVKELFQVINPRVESPFSFNICGGRWL